jgi:hypothetical protein
VAADPPGHRKLGLADQWGRIDGLENILGNLNPWRIGQFHDQTLCYAPAKWDPDELSWNG